MEGNNKVYWKGLEELSNDIHFVKNAEREFPEGTPLPGTEAAANADIMPASRRDFLKVMGFGMAAVTLAACEAPVKKAIPYLNKPEEIEASIANYYASTYVDTDGDYNSVLVKTREGRPIKIEPNPLSGVTPAGTSARAQASLLSLYDLERLKGPFNGKEKKATDWKSVDAAIGQQLQQVASSGKAIRIVSSTIISPSTKAAIREFIAKYPTAQHVTYDANSSAGILNANQTSFGKAVLPFYNFDKAEVIVGIGNADFLGTSPGSTTYSALYAKTRKLGKDKKKMSRHYQFESTLSSTGANADYRTPIKSSQEGLVAANLYNKIAKKLGAAPVSAPALDVKGLDDAANELASAKSAGVVVAGSNDPNVQTIVNAINNLLGSYSTIIDLNAPLTLKAGDDTAMANFVKELSQGQVGAVFFYNANPVYDYPTGKQFGEDLKKASLKVSFSDRMDETTSLCDYVCPDHNFLEAWNDAEPRTGYFSLGQPTINPIFQTRAAQQSLLAWAGNTIEYDKFIQSYWRTNLFSLQSKYSSFKEFWIHVLHDGVFEPKNAPVTAVSFGGDVNAAAAAVGKAGNNGIELVLYQKIGIGNGAMANNPWLQELPDPISRACWDNYLTVSHKMASELGLTQSEEDGNDLVTIEIPGKPAITLPALIQPGQAEGTVGLALGYGREKAGKAANNVGVNAYPFASVSALGVGYVVNGVKVTKAGEKRKIAQVQTHHTIMARPIVQEAKLSEYQKKANAGRFMPKVATSEGKKKATDISLWHGHKYQNHSWGMVIDLNSCTGCGSCVVACTVENNVPVVGRQEVINRREMHWLRIDRYYSSDAPKDDVKGLEEASANPEVVFQPMLCQHCNNAPCETVCPVLATTHSSEGLNQMTYNRCFGTRYCANNCPYKVRRFNWFNYTNDERFSDVNYMSQTDLGKMVLNPDVTVRTRGVMEKCSMCVQRIQEGKLNAKKERRRPVDGEIAMACESACSSGAILFGDMNDPESRISKLIAEETEGRMFQVLEEINTRPQVSYLTKIRNKA
ncbi:TAT-variant-translocated molybdopterin oxidoreductase [Xanthocytophaga agilis]|uniref:TAT-variant-translocated molybdopterin oxidoreductase n=1 Tax=Xanthocytophaga agilis TaxID=3048010 RepID=A0AAE3R355_9BACT|nr:TAT-variant-translocated molybdopterin oxidoreductase [Xanthocytophaga agilis]MDJ1500742.1 TAT-variant-translocated molybdopterin oxidoreductase [Xanthocytophaga agilis]